MIRDDEQCNVMATSYNNSYSQPSLMLIFVLPTTNQYTSVVTVRNANRNVKFSKNGLSVLVSILSSNVLMLQAVSNFKIFYKSI